MILLLGNQNGLYAKQYFFSLFGLPFILSSIIIIISIDSTVNSYFGLFAIQTKCPDNQCFLFKIYCKLFLNLESFLVINYLIVFLTFNFSIFSKENIFYRKVNATLHNSIIQLSTLSVVLVFSYKFTQYEKVYLQISLQIYMYAYGKSWI